MKTIKLIIKGILLWITTIATILFLCGIDSIVESNYALVWLAIVSALIYSSYRIINEEELKIISGSNWMNKLSKENSDTDYNF